MNRKETEQGKVVRETIRYFIIQYLKEHGYPPTFREIGEGTGLSSSSSVYGHMKKLKEEGAVDYMDGAPRTITVPGYGFRKLQQGGGYGGRDSCGGTAGNRKKEGMV